MILGQVVGTVVATRKDPRLESAKLLVVRVSDARDATGLTQPARSPRPGGGTPQHLVAVDTVDAGFGETVLVVSGSSARMSAGLKDCPVDAAIVGIVDAVELND